MSRYPIVGAFYRPPAQALLSVLPSGAPLMLRAEPDNPADPNAVAVWLKTSTIPSAAHETLEENVEGYGFALDAILAEAEWHLGYIPRTFAAQLRANDTVPLGASIPAAFAISADGSPRVVLSD